jgi:hypothetical protein
VGHALDDMLPLAVGIAVSPVPILCVLLMLTSARGTVHAAWFTVGWFIGVVAVCAALAASGLGGKDTNDHAIAVAQLILGGLLLVFGVVVWIRQPGGTGGESSGPPPWLRVLDHLTPVRAVGAGVLVAIINPKDFALSAAAGVRLDHADIALGPTLGALAIFGIVASVTVAIPVVAAALLGERAEALLARAHDGLGRYGDRAVAVTCVGIAVLLLAQGLANL